MSEWITDRRPINDDEEYVFNQFGDMVHYLDIKQGEPWMRIERPEPYVKPKRFYVKWYNDKKCWAIFDNEYLFDIITQFQEEADDEQREAAERIAAIYEEVMP